jgi:tetratricopeptide (TPR) repeat protein
MVEPLVRDRQGDPVLATTRLRLQAGRLQAFRDGGYYPEAIATFERAAGLGEELLAEGAGAEDLSEILARTYINASFVFVRVGRLDDASQAAIRGHELAEEATREHPGDPMAARTLVLASTQACESLRDTGRTDEARRLCEQGIAFGKAWVGEHPRDVEMRMNLASLEIDLSVIERNTGHTLEAVTILRGVSDGLSVLARENPLLIRARWYLASGLFNLSSLQADVGQYAESERSARTSVELAEALVREVPSSPVYRTMSGLCYATLGKARLKAGSRGEALTMWRKAVAILETNDDDWLALINMACVFALSSTVADPEEGPAAAGRQRRDGDRAVATIRRAIALGYTDAGMLRNDPDFDCLRSRPDFQVLLMDLAFPAEPFARAE